MIRRLQKEAVMMENYSENGIRYEKINDNIFNWYVYLKDFDKDSNIQKSMDKYSVEHLKIELIISDKHPFKPPFIRIISPILVNWHSFITPGGSLCLDLLTGTGWAPTYQLVTLIIQLKVFIKDALINKDKLSEEYTLEDAHKWYTKTSRIHNWENSHKSIK